MSGLSEFIAFWSDPSRAQNDAAFKLAHAYTIADARLKALRASTLGFMQPTKNSKGAWVPGFSPDVIDQAAALGTEIERTEAKLKSIAHDIEAFLELSGGKPTITEIGNERNRHTDRIRHVERVAATALKRAVDKDPHTSPAVLMQRADISQAYKDLQQAKDETAEPIAELTGRIDKMKEIIERHEATA